MRLRQKALANFNQHGKSSTPGSITLPAVPLQCQLCQHYSASLVITETTVLFQAADIYEHDMPHAVMFPVQYIYVGEKVAAV